MKNIFLSSKQLFEEIGKVVNLYKNIWRERTICLLHARRETPKSDRALDIAIEVAAAGRKTLYVNVDRKISLYTDRLASTNSENLLFATPNFDGPDDSRDFADIVFELIETAVKEHQIETFVIDSVSRIAALSTGRNASVKRIMKRLSIMQMRYSISILAVAHIDSKASLRSLLDFVDSQIDINPPKPEKKKKKSAATAPADNLTNSSNPSDSSENSDSSDKSEDNRRAIEDPRRPSGHRRHPRRPHAPSPKSKTTKNLKINKASNIL